MQKSPERVSGDFLSVFFIETIRFSNNKVFLIKLIDETGNNLS